MDKVLTELTKLTIDPFARARCHADVQAWAAGADLQPDEFSLACAATPPDAGAVAAGDWQSADTCWDPGSDQIPDYNRL